MEKTDADSSNTERKSLVSIEEYRRMLNDNQSTDERILYRLRYLEAFLSNIIQLELEKFMKPNKANKRGEGNLPFAPPDDKLNIQ